MNEVRDYSWDDLKVGMKHEFDVVVTDEMMRNFRDTTGDVNPLHTDDSFAQSKGFPSAVVYGLLTSSLYSTLAGVYLPGKHCLLHGVDANFLGPAFVGDHLVVSGEITYLNESFHQIVISASIKKAGGKRISRAKIKAGVLGDRPTTH
jgi:3-hydroxybutyryl-CoA dehydratase